MKINHVQILRAPLLISVFVFLSGCHTLLESTQPIPPVYSKETNERGETVYKSQKSRPRWYEPYEQSYTSKPWVNSSLESTNVRSNEPLTKNPIQLQPQNLQQKASISGFLEFANGDGNTHLGVHVGLPVLTDLLHARGGLSMFLSNSDTYLGFDGSARLKIFRANLSPFIGLGAYFGDSKKCQQDLFEGEVCEKKFLSAGYGEIGFQYQGFHIFWRDYNITRAGLNVPTNGLWGIGLSSNF